MHYRYQPNLQISLWIMSTGTKCITLKSIPPDIQKSSMQSFNFSSPFQKIPLCIHPLTLIALHSSYIQLAVKPIAIIRTFQQTHLINTRLNTSTPLGLNPLITVYLIRKCSCFVTAAFFINQSRGTNSQRGAGGDLLAFAGFYKQLQFWTLGHILRYSVWAHLIF